MTRNPKQLSFGRPPDILHIQTFGINGENIDAALRLYGSPVKHLRIEPAAVVRYAVQQEPGSWLFYVYTFKKPRRRADLLWPTVDRVYWLPIRELIKVAKLVKVDGQNWLRFPATILSVHRQPKAGRK